jgi:RNase P subunit RPR2
MPRAHTSFGSLDDPPLDGAGHTLGMSTGLRAVSPVAVRHMSCSHCDHPLECVEQNRRMGTWLGSFMCPNCRSEYFYAYRWGRLERKA